MRYRIIKKYGEEESKDYYIVERYLGWFCGWEPVQKNHKLFSVGGIFGVYGETIEFSTVSLAEEFVISCKRQDTASEIIKEM